jgi:DNA-binding transcriptional regulator YhcF (GntR family)
MAHSSVELELERGADLPVGVDLAWRLEVLIQSGRLPAGTRLPGVREFAAGSGVNVNTARSIYRRLEEQGLAVSRQGRGTFVAPHVAVSPTLEQFAAQVAEDCLAQGIDPRELARALYAGTAPGALDLPPADDAAGAEDVDAEDARLARVSLRGQIARLEARLASYPEAEGARPAGGPPRVAGLGELEAVRDELVGRLERAREHAAREGRELDRERGRFEDAVADPAGHRWEAGQLDELGEPGCGRWQVRPAWGPVGALMNWWRVKISSGCP